MTGARALHMAPRKIAEALIVAPCALEGTWFHLRRGCRPRLPKLPPGQELVSATARWQPCGPRARATARADAGPWRKVMVEFVSANPTGPMHMGNARGGALGDCLASVLDARRLRCLAGVLRQRRRQPDRESSASLHRAPATCSSSWARKRSTSPRTATTATTSRSLPRASTDIYGDGLPEAPRGGAPRRRWLRFGLPKNIAKDAGGTCANTASSTTQWFFEVRAARERLRQGRSVRLLTEQGLTYEKDGALWLRSCAIPPKLLLRARPRRRADPRTRCCAAPTASTPILPLTSPTTATSSTSAALTGSSTSGAPITTATWPASRARWTPWAWTAITGWTSC